MISAKTFSVFLAAALFLIIAFGLIYLFAGSVEKSPWFIFAYVVGLSMIVLPCTLPLAFVIVPLSMGQGYRKGILIAVFFGIGVTFTLGLYGAAVALLGKVVGLDDAKNVMYTIAGAAAIIFGLSEAGFIKVRIPAYSGKVPDFVQNRGDYLKSLFLGMFLGNVGFGCPNPAFYVLLGYIATVGSVETGWFLTTVHALGRITPLLFLALLGILGINALPKLVVHKEKIGRTMGWALIFVGVFIFSVGAFTHDWYVYSGIHSFLEAVTQEEFLVGVLGERFGGKTHFHEMPEGPYLAAGQIIFLLLLTLPIIWNYFRKKAEARELLKDSSPEREIERKTALAILPLLKWNAVLLVALILLIFGYYLPQRFRDAAREHEREESGTEVHVSAETVKTSLVSLLTTTAAAHGTASDESVHADSQAVKSEDGAVKNFLVSWRGKLLVSLVAIAALLAVTFKLLTPRGS